MNETIPAAPEQSGPLYSDPIDLNAPIVRGETRIETLRLRKPRSGELRGLTLQDVMQTDFTALLTLIPRISEPPLTADEADRLDPADIAEIGGTIRGFFMTRAERQMLEAMLAAHQPKT